MTESDSKDEVDELLKNEEDVSFSSLGVVDVLCETCEELGWKKPSKIQQEAIPLAIEGKDIIGLAETGSGKTGAFCIPILQVSIKAVIFTSLLYEYCAAVQSMVSSSLTVYFLFMRFDN